MFKHKLVDFLIQFIQVRFPNPLLGMIFTLQDIDAEMSAMKISVSTRARLVSKEYLTAFK